MAPIPSNISKEHILKAIEYLDETGVPPKNKPTGYILEYNNNSYPPKHVLRIANIFANGKELVHFSGGEHTNGYLRNLGFTIKPLEKKSNLPIISHSWTVISETYASKKVDKSLFLHHVTGIPKDIRFFFSIEKMKTGEAKHIKIIYNNKTYNADIVMFKNSRTKLIFSLDLWKSVISKFPIIYNRYKKSEIVEVNLKLKFEKINDNEYLVYFYQPVPEEIIQSDIESEKAEENFIAASEGSIKHYYGKRYERNGANRRKAIEIHGTTCITCGFNFEETYGEHGKGFIEIYHLKPLNVYGGKEVKVDPYNDLVPLCANCHRMIHRNKESVLSIEELKKIINIDHKKK